MTETADCTIESLQLLVGEKDATIEKLKTRATAYVEKLKADHAELLLKETTARQNLQVHLNTFVTTELETCPADSSVSTWKLIRNRTSWKRRSQFSSV